MAEVRIEKPTPQKLKDLGVDRWGTWECEPSTFDWSYDSAETCYILEGKVRVTTPSGTVEFGRGDLVRFPKGLNCTWTVVEKVRKKYSFE
ncbi:MAG: cupin domain-containing protein [Candidatus Aureabacteria bacterium]|nr:cupin domain-containing protein [Candidatus Auribacterota bacterium]